MRIERWEPGRDGPFSEPSMRRKLESRGYLHSERTYPAGAVAAAQPASQDRVEAVVSGMVKMTVGGEAAILAAGDLVIVPRGEIRRLEVVGPAPARCFEGIRSERSD